MTERIIQGDTRAILKTLSAESVDCCITSPPYWGLRDYGTAKWEGGNPECSHKQKTARNDAGRVNVQGFHGSASSDSDKGEMNYRDVCGKCGAIRIDSQIGLEKTPEEYVAKLVEIFREVRRVLKKEGTVWLNLGDSYVSQRLDGSHGGWNASGGYYTGRHKNDGVKHEVDVGNLKTKDLVGIPWRVAFALQADGWWLRQDIIWNKPNCMPESVTDRCTKNHEYVFLLAKSQKYYFDAEAIKEQALHKEDVRAGYGRLHYRGKRQGYSGTGQENFVKIVENRNKRSVWTITTSPFSEAHFAVFPEALVEPMIKAGTSEKGVCPDCEKAWERNEQIIKHVGHKSREDEKHFKCGSGQHFSNEKKSLGWQPTCKCGKEPMPATVLDIFCGSGTTGVVAKKLGRNFIGIELKEDYCKLANERIAGFERKDWKAKKTHKTLEAI